MTSREAAYISSGTWSLVGMELDEPVLTGASRTANFTNEGGVDGRIRHLRNAMGMWVLNECVDAWRREDEEAELERVLDDAARASRWVVFDVDHPSLVPAGDMPSRVERLVTDAGQTRLSRGELVRSILESLAHSYAVTLDELEALTGVAVDAVHLVGGGSQNPLLCQLVADHSGRTVAAGPVEATAIGNVVVQARAAGLVSGDLEAVRLRVAAAFPPRWYEPKA
jgi:rhamnulokinase